MDFEVFLADMGLKQEGLELDRIDNSKGYYPGNCRWVTRQENCNNRRSNRFMETSRGAMTVAEISREAGVTMEAILGRIKRGVQGDDLLKPRSGQGGLPSTTF
jgi:hypothetical protein